MATADWRAARVLSVDSAASDMVSLVVAPEVEVPYRAGQHFEIRFAGDDFGRKYSVVSSPHTSGPLEFGIQLLPKGRLSPRLAASSSGDRIEIRGPLGEAFVWTPDLGPSLVLVGGGAGITPLLSIHAHFTHCYPEGRCSFLMSAKRPERVYHLDRYAPFLTTRFTESENRIVRADLEEMLADFLGDAGVNVRICGPGGMIDSVVDDLIDLGFPEHNIRSEAFV